MRTGFVYILKCSDGSFYTGVTNDLERRLSEHTASNARSYVASRKPIALVWVSDEMNIQDAILLEKQIKGWRRDKKIALINNQCELLPGLSTAYDKK